jgi:hypothetical protein
MAERSSLLSEAWHRTELRGFKKIYTTVVAGIVTLYWNYKMGLRTLQFTEWFGVCVVGAWLSLTILEFCGYLTIGWIRDKYLTFMAQLNTELREAVTLKPEVADSPTRSQTLYLPRLPHVEEAKRLVAKLSETPDQLRILSYMGDPESYKFGEYLKSLFTTARWTVQHDADPIVPSAPGLRLAVADVVNMPEIAKTVAIALSAAGLFFTVERLPPPEKRWCLLVGRSS